MSSKRSREHPSTSCRARCPKWLISASTVVLWRNFQCYQPKFGRLRHHKLRPLSPPTVATTTSKMANADSKPGLMPIIVEGKYVYGFRSILKSTLLHSEVSSSHWSTSDSRGDDIRARVEDHQITLKCGFLLFLYIRMLEAIFSLIFDDIDSISVNYAN